MHRQYTYVLDHVFPFPPRLPPPHDEYDTSFKEEQQPLQWPPSNLNCRVTPPLVTGCCHLLRGKSYTRVAASTCSRRNLAHRKFIGTGATTRQNHECSCNDTVGSRPWPSDHNNCPSLCCDSIRWVPRERPWRPSEGLALGRLHSGSTHSQGSAQPRHPPLHVWLTEGPHSGVRNRSAFDS